MMRWERMGSWEEATAVVIRHRPDLRDKEGKAVYVDMRYAVPRCGEYNLRLWSTAPDFYPVGSTVAVLYDPAMPQMAREDSFDGLYALPLAMMGFGSVFAVLGLLFGRIFYRGYDREL